MLTQEVLNILIGSGLAIMGWFCREMWAAVSELKADLSKLREELPQQYVSKYDYRDDINDIKNILIRIDAKFEGKVDKKL